MSIRFKSVAVDGPSGAGKSTLARMLARALGYVYVDTGAIYRSVALFTLRRGADPGDGAAVAALLPELRLELKYDGEGTQHVLMNGEDVTGLLRGTEVSRGASRVSAFPAVRAFLLDMQRDMARTSNVVMDGRDIGTVVLPEADAKIFLTASPEERARRRHEEQVQKGMESRYEDVLEQMKDRDRADTGRKAAPLRRAEDAIPVNTTGNSLERSFELLLKLVKEKLGE